MASLPKKRLRLSQTGHDGILEWALDLHVPVGAHVTCVPSGPHLVVEEVEGDLLQPEEELLALSKQEPKHDEPFSSNDTTVEDSRNKLMGGPSTDNGSSSSTESSIINDSAGAAATKAESDAYLRDLVSATDDATAAVKSAPPKPIASVYSYTYAGSLPRVFCDRTLLRDNVDSSSNKDWENWHEDVPTPRQVAVVRTTTLDSGGRPIITVPPRSAGGLRTVPTTPTKRPWSTVIRRRESGDNKEEGPPKALRRATHPEVAPKSRVHFTADGSIPVCRMPKCQRPMYFYKNEDRWRCNLNRGGCGAVFHNIGRDIGPCSKCSRPVGEEHPCHEWCACRYCSNNKKQLVPTPSSSDAVLVKSGGSSTGDSPSLSADVEAASRGGGDRGAEDDDESTTWKPLSGSN